MNITYIGRQVNVYEDQKQLVEKKLAKFDRYFPGQADATVTFRKIRDNECMEITISVGNTLFRAEEQAEKYSMALTRCVDVIEGQIRKNKTRLEKIMKKGAFVIEEDDDDEFIEEEEFSIREKTYPPKPMSAKEAILQMNLLGHAFFVFLNDESNETCVVYKRKDGGYGLIVPER